MDAVGAFGHFRDSVNKQFLFLVDEYCFVEAEATMLLPGMWVKFRNSSTAQVTVEFEYGGPGLTVTVGRLAVVGGVIVSGEQYNLDFLLSVRAPHRVRTMAMLDYDERAVETLLADRAEVLHEYAQDVLRGDFAIFPKLAEVRASMNRRSS